MFAMGFVLFIAVAVILLFSGIRKIPQTHRGIVERLGRQLPGAREPGFVWMLPIFDRLHLISVEPFEVSLPPQSSITSDEIPIQLQASLVAQVVNPEKATTVKDWRISTMSALQNLMKDRLEDLDFDRLQTEFSDWVANVRKELDQLVAVFGIEIRDLQISNLSPRTRPQ